MNLSFSAEQEEIRQEFRRFLQGRSPMAGLRRLLDERAAIDRALWQQMADLGWLASALPETDGGMGLPSSLLCVLAEELGRQPALVPYACSVLGAADALNLLRERLPDAPWLRDLGAGLRIGAPMDPAHWQDAPERCADRVSGRTRPLPDGTLLDLLLTLLPSADGGELCLLDLRTGSVERDPSSGLDPLHPAAALRLDGVHLTRLAAGAEARTLWDRLRNRRAVFTAFEQIGGAEACLAMARTHVSQRVAFGRVIGSFQAVKLAMADMLVAIELARSNAYFGAWALSQPDDLLAEAAAVARIAATDAYRLCARQNIQLHGALGATWESDCHLHYRRAQTLGLRDGPPRFWKEQLVRTLESRSVTVAAVATTAAA